MLVASPFIWIAMRVFKRDRLIRQWPRAEALVTSSGATTSTRRNDDPNAAWGSTYTWYSPYVRYTYTVEGKTFEGSSIGRSVDRVDMDKPLADRILKRYPAGAKVSAFVDPADPSKAHLEVGRSIGAIILLALGLVWAAIGALLAGLSFV